MPIVWLLVNGVLQVGGGPEIVPFVVPYFLTAFVFLLAITSVYVIGKFMLVPIVGRVLEQRGFDPTVRKVARRIATAGVWLIAIAIAFTLAGFGSVIAALGVFAGALALAVGFAARDLIGNFVAGMFILKDKHFEAGDRIEWNGFRGRIEEIDLRVSRVRSFDNELITVPNSDLANSAVINPVAYDRLRREATFEIGYDADIGRAKEVIRSVVAQHDEVLGDPLPTIRVSELGDSAVVLRVRYWIPEPAVTDFVRIQAEVVEAVKERFDAEGIDMPYPHRTLEGNLSVAGAVPTTNRATADGGPGD